MLFYETEAASGFLHRLAIDHEFDTAGWQRIWTAVASLLHHHHGELDAWQSYDLTRIVTLVQYHGQTLVGRTYSSLTDFEMQILEANKMLQEMLE